jgi:flagellar biosynthesis protein FliR
MPHLDLFLLGIGTMLVGALALLYLLVNLWAPKDED